MGALQHGPIPYGAQGVWGSYTAVYHLGEAPNDGVATIINSTSSIYNGSSEGSMTSANLSSPKLGDGLGFDGSNDAINIGTSPNFSSTDSFTWQCWSKTTNTSAKAMIAKGVNSQPYEGLNFFLNGGRFIFSMVSSGGTSEQIYKKTLASGYPDGNWHSYYASYDGSESSAGIELFVDGSKPGFEAGGNWSGSISTSRKLKIGSRDGGIYWAGGIDEVRFSKVVRSPEWVQTEYSNQSSTPTFYTVSN